jgi:hypothetical protein
MQSISEFVIRLFMILNHESPVFGNYASFSRLVCMMIIPFALFIKQITNHFSPCNFLPIAAQNWIIFVVAESKK